MRTRNALERLAIAGRPLLAAADALVGDRDVEQILERILASPRIGDIARSRPRRRLLVPVLVGAAVIAAAVAVASIEIGAGTSPTARGTGHGLTGATLQLAGYHFRTPTGFKASKTSCVPGSSNSFSAAASADGGCVEAFNFISSSGPPTAVQGAEPVTVGLFHGYFVPQDTSGRSALYVQLPTLNHVSQYLVLLANGLTEDQLIAVAESGLPTTLSPTTTTGAESGG